MLLIGQVRQGQRIEYVEAASDFDKKNFQKSSGGEILNEVVQH